jgi:hypothetical protein
VLALEPLRGLRVIASPDALDGARWTGSVTVLRFAPDEALAIGAITVDIDDSDAIVERETGFVGARLTAADLERLVAHMDWPLPTEPGALAQGKIAGVPAKVLVGEPSLLLTQASYADDLMSRLI